MGLGRSNVHMSILFAFVIFPFYGSFQGIPKIEHGGVSPFFEKRGVVPQLAQEYFLFQTTFQALFLKEARTPNTHTLAARTITARPAAQTLSW